jgi:hypothetical protein
LCNGDDPVDDALSCRLLVTRRIGAAPAGRLATATPISAAVLTIPTNACGLRILRLSDEPDHASDTPLEWIVRLTNHFE